MLVMSGTTTKELVEPSTSELIDLSNPTRGCSWDKELPFNETAFATSST